MCFENTRTNSEECAEHEDVGFDHNEDVKPRHALANAYVIEENCAECASNALHLNDDDSDVTEVEWGDRNLYNERPVGDFYICPEDEDAIYTYCPLCGCNSGIYGGNRWYTDACCYFHVKDKDISLEVERWTAEHLLAGECIDEVHAKLSALRRHPTMRSYVELINAILNDARTATDYKKYLELGYTDTGSKTESQHELAARAIEEMGE